MSYSGDLVRTSLDNVVGKGVDIKVSTGYFCAAPSVGKNKVPYVENFPLVPPDQLPRLPDEWEALIARPEPKTDRPITEAQQPRTATNARQMARYAATALDLEIGPLRTALDGDSGKRLFNNAGLSLGQLVGEGLLDRAVVERDIESACRANGYIKDHGQTTFENKLKHAIEDGIVMGRNLSHVGNETDAGEFDEESGTSSITFSDKGNATALAREYAKQIRYVPELGRWIHWNGTRWSIDPDTGMIDTAAGAIATALPNAPKDAATHRKRSLSVSGITGMTRLARSDPAMRISNNRLDANAFQLNTPTGIVDLRTGQVSDHARTAWHTKITGVGYEPGVPCPQWDAFLHTTFDGDHEMIDYMQRLIGEAAIGKVLRHVLPFCHGEGANGKTVLLEVIQLVLGEYAVTAPHNFLMAGRDKHETEIASTSRCPIRGVLRNQSGQQV